jgi:predicted HTH transcriptional regulator
MTQGTILLDTVLGYVEKHGSITNRECREILGVSYDHAIKLLGGLASTGLLKRTGSSSSTKYVRGTRKPSKNKVQAVLTGMEQLLKCSKK